MLERGLVTFDSNCLLSFFEDLKYLAGARRQLDVPKSDIFISFVGFVDLKKLNSKARNWLRVRALNQKRRKANPQQKRPLSPSAKKQYHAQSVQIWQGGEPERAICTAKPVRAPAHLSFQNNGARTTEFLTRTRRHGMLSNKARNESFVTRSSPNSMARIAGYLDFSSIAHISTGAAVVLTADYERLSRLLGEVPPTIDLPKWSPQVVTRLHQIGFFSILGHLPQIEARLVEDGPTLTMRILSATKAEGFEQVDSALQELCKFLLGDDGYTVADLDDTIVKVLTSISEAITNVTQHAYPSNHQYEHEHVERFWIAATSNRIDKTLTVVVYDQGASIPVTYPKLNRVDKVLRFLERAIRRRPEFAYQNDGAYIRAAMRYGGSRTDKPYRGKGFPQMYEILQSVGKGSLSVRSRGGWCRRAPDGRVRSGSLTSSIGGTLIEWKIDMSAELAVKER
jgi:hypothetical protein